MKYELMGRTLKGYVPAVNRSAVIEEMQDTIIPDSLPDIARILGCPAEGIIREKEATQRGVRVSGMIRADALFTDDQYENVYSIPINLPFTYLFEKEGLSPADAVFADILITSGEAREVNPRKLSVRVEAIVSCRVFAGEERDITEEVVDPGDVEYLNQKAYVCVTVAVAGKTFTINETAEMPAGREGIGKIITYSCVIDNLESKLIQNKAVVKGEAIVKVLYNPTGGGRPEGIAFELPFSQIADLEGADEECSLVPKVVCLGSDLGVQETGDSAGRELDIGLYLELQLVACRMQEINPIVDAYDCKKELDIAYDTLILTDASLSSAGNVQVRESIECEHPIKSVLYAAIGMIPACGTNDEGEEILDSTANILIIYISDDGQIRSLARRMSVVLPEGDDCLPADIGLAVRDIDYSIGLTGNLDMRFSVDIVVSRFSDNNIDIIDSIETDDETQVREEGRPSVILRYPSEGERFWDIAKSYRTTRDAIFSANGLEPSETAPEGKLLLIPRK